MTLPARQVRAVFDDQTITVYQAFGHDIADAALAVGTFVSPFSFNRMTWIKPSFLWMMYRCGWGSKPDQQRVLAIRIRRSGFEEALSSSCMSHFDATRYGTHDAWQRALLHCSVRVQWDPERAPDGRSVECRSLQVGLSGSFVASYVTDWIQSIDDLTESLDAMRREILPLPNERPYPLSSSIAMRISATG